MCLGKSRLGWRQCRRREQQRGSLMGLQGRLGSSSSIPGLAEPFSLPTLPFPPPPQAVGTAFPPMPQPLAGPQTSGGGVE